MIPYSDLSPQLEPLQEQLREAVARVIDARQFILGRFVEEFEAAFAAWCGVEHAIAVNSGTSALHLALLAAGVGPGDEVITVPFTFAATAAAIHYCGARPVFADIDPATFTLDPVRFAEAVTPRTKAVIPVHLYGQPADMDPILELARSRGIAVIEDAAQAHGATYKGRMVGGIGHLGCFSFYPTKNLGACGEGGLVTTRDAALARTVRLLRDWGQDRKYHHALRGFNYRMEGIQGAVLKVKLPHLPGWNEARQATARLYDSFLESVPEVVRPVCAAHATHVYHTYTIRAPERDRLREWLGAAGIGTATHYPVPLHLQPAYADPLFPEGSLPEAEGAARQVLSLPMYAGMPAEHAEEVVRQVRAFYARRA